MADYGFKVTPPGFDVLSATDAQLAFTSKAFGIKILSQGVATVTATAGAGTTTVAHGLAYAPAYIAYPSGLSSDCLCINDSTMPDSNSVFTNAWSDTTNLNLKITNNGTTVFKYYIFVEDSD